MSKIIDLHIHTNCSDGKFSPLEIIDMAKNNNVFIIAITDHDTLKAYSNVVLSYAAKKGIKLINAIEISTKFKGYGIHILGYGFDLKNKELLKMIEKAENARFNYLLEVSAKLEQFGFIVNLDNLKNLPSVTKYHIANEVIQNQKNKKIIDNIFHKVPSIGKFIETIMNENCPCFVEKYCPSPQNISQIIKQAGGKVVIAHPVAYIYENNFDIKDIEDLIKEIKRWGIESYNWYVDKFGKVINEVEKWKDIANKYGLVNTIGYAFHNFGLNNAVLGLLNTDLSLNEEELTNILEGLL